MLSQPSKLSDREDRLDEVILSYLQAVDSGQTPEPEQLLARHPDLAAELKAYFADQKQVDPLLAPLRELAPPPSSPDCPLRSFGDYEVLQTIAQGGMGVVCKARQISLNRLVALKMIRNRRLADPGDVQRFRTEAENAAHLDHPHIVPIYEVGEWRPEGDNTPIPFFSMKLIEGGSLAQQTPRFTADPRASAALLATVARAVHHAHQRGILHRDLKPANILLDRLDQPHVSDFGLARRIETEGGLTQSGAIVGTPEYMAPEQARAEKGLSTAVDVYSLGAIFYELLTGRTPFRGPNILETLQAAARDEPAPPHNLNPKVDRDLETICLKCLHKEPLRRYESAEELARELDRWLQGEPILARPIGRTERLWRWCQRNPVVAVLSALVAMLVVVVAASLVVSNLLLRQEEQETKAALKREAEQRRQAEAAQKEANANFLRARRAVQQMLLEVASKKLTHIPEMTNVRQVLLEEALRFYEQVLRERGADGEVRREAAVVYQWLGQIYLVQGRHGKAESVFAKAIALQRTLAAEFPNQPVHRYQLAGVLGNWGLMKQRAGHLPPAEKVYDEALAMLDKLSVDYPKVPAYRHERALILLNLAAVFVDTNRPRKAEDSYALALKLEKQVVVEAPAIPHFRHGLAKTLYTWGVFLDTRNRPREALQAWRQAVELQEKLHAQWPKLPAYRAELARASNSLGNLLITKFGRFPDGIKAIEGALAAQKALVAEFPEVLVYRQDLATTYNNLGLRYWARRSSRAETAFREALALREQLAAASPAIADYQSNLAATLNNLALPRIEQGEFWGQRRPLMQARELLEKAIGHQRAALNTNSRNPTYRHFLRQHYLNLGDTLVLLREHQEAARAAEELPRLFPSRAQENYQAARLLARCVPVAAKDAKLTEPKRKQMAKAYADRAMNLLREAVQHGFRNAAILRKDAAFDSLRQRDEYKQFVQELVTKSR